MLKPSPPAQHATVVQSLHRCRWPHPELGPWEPNCPGPCLHKLGWPERDIADTDIALASTVMMRHGLTTHTFNRIVVQSASRKGGKALKKGDLPSKVCLCCGRPFTWRKKWESCWDEVRRVCLLSALRNALCIALANGELILAAFHRYCSDRCRNQSKGLQSTRRAVDVPQLGHSL